MILKPFKENHGSDQYFANIEKKNYRFSTWINFPFFKKWHSPETKIQQDAVIPLNFEVAVVPKSS